MGLPMTLDERMEFMETKWEVIVENSGSNISTWDFTWERWMDVKIVQDWRAGPAICLYVCLASQTWAGVSPLVQTFTRACACVYEHCV